MLKGKLPDEMYKNFMLFSIATRILASQYLCGPLCGYAKDLLICFVKHLSQLYGTDQMVYNVHGLVHIADDVKLYGPLDRFAAFPFENFLKSLKQVIRKPNFVLEQVIHRFLERSFHACHSSDESSDNLGTCINGVSVNMPHTDGPLPSEGYFPCTQFRNAKLHGFVLSTKRGNNCVQVGSKCVLVRNVFQYKSGVYILYNEFLIKESFFSYPLESKNVGIHKVSSISNVPLIADIKSVKIKYVLLPYQKKHVAIPLIHLFQSIK